MAVARTDDRVHLPVPDLLAQFHGGRTLGDVALAGEATALLGASVAFSPLGRLSEKKKQRSSLLLVTTDEAVDRLVADGELALAPKPATDLLGAQPLAQKPSDEFPVGGHKSLIPPGLPASSLGLVLCMACSIDAVAPRAVARELAADGASMAAHKTCNLGDGESRNLLAERSERIPLREGDLVIVQCETFLPEDFASVPDRPSSQNPFVAVDL